MSTTNGIPWKPRLLGGATVVALLMIGCSSAPPETRAGSWHAQFTEGELGFEVDDRGSALIGKLRLKMSCGPGTIESNVDLGSASVPIADRKFDFELERWEVRGKFSRDGTRVSGTIKLGKCKSRWNADKTGAAPSSVGSPAQSLEPASARLALVPFHCLGQASQDTGIAQALYDEILSQLSRMDAPDVQPASAMARFADVEASPQEIGRKIGARHIVQGSIRRTDQRIQLILQVHDVPNDVVLFADVYELSADRAGVAEHVARDILMALGV